MSWIELERLVDTAEVEATLRSALSHCRSRRELLLACQRLGFGIEERDLRMARRLHAQQGVEPSCVAPRRDAAADPPRLDRCG